MVQESYNPDQISYELALRLRDIEENNKLMKERVLLIGKNVIEFNEKNSLEMIELKKQIQSLEDEVKRLKSIVSTLSEEVSKSARKEELAILRRQFKMFEPLELVRMEDLDEIIDEKLHHHSKREDAEKQKNAFWSGKL